jgi:3-hydroxybutyryl-CoA dehydratase
MKEGDKFEVNYTITPEVYKVYVEGFADKNPLHTDEEFAKQKGFPSVVMHGGILTGFLSNFIGEQLPIKNVMIQAYKITFVKPVFLHTTVTLKAEITGIFESVHCMEFKYSFECQDVQVCKGDIKIGII